MTTATAQTFPAATEWKLPSKRKVGMLCLIVTESSLFTIFVVAYLFYLGKSLNGPYPKDVIPLPILASICLLSSSVTVALAERAFKRGKSGAFKLWWFITIAPLYVSVPRGCLLRGRLPRRRSAAARAF
jgi:cytochrome c oxidase subunit 3/cytochrome o ubiquinol oxidase subunit 3